MIPWENNYSVLAKKRIFVTSPVVKPFDPLGNAFSTTTKASDFDKSNFNGCSAPSFDLSASDYDGGLLGMLPEAQNEQTSV